MKPGHNGGGNPNHDENGRFTSNGNASSGNNNSEEKQAMELFNLKGSEKKDKYYPSTLDGNILDEEGIEASSEEEAYKIAEQRFGKYGDELTVEKAESEKSSPSIDLDEINRRKQETPEQSANRLKEDLRKQREELNAKNNAQKESVENYASQLGWKSDPNNPKADAEHFLIERSLNNLIEQTNKHLPESVHFSKDDINQDWVSDLAYQMQSDGVPEELINGLTRTFYDETISQEDWQKNLDEKNKDLLDSIEDVEEDDSDLKKVKALFENPTDYYNSLPENSWRRKYQSLDDYLQEYEDNKRYGGPFSDYAGIYSDVFKDEHGYRPRGDYDGILRYTAESLGIKPNTPAYEYLKQKMEDFKKFHNNSTNYSY